MLRKKHKISIKHEIYSVPIPPNWREGQFVFNRVDELYGVARAIQFIDKVDCFYDDSKIDEFIERTKVWISKPR